MTGFSRASANAREIAVAVEIKSVNGKGLDLRLRVPPGLDFLDTVLRPLIQQRFSRGSLQINVVVDLSGARVAPRINQELLDQLLVLTSDLVTRHNASPPTADGLLAIRGVVDVPDNDPDDAQRDAIAAVARDAMQLALADLEKARIAEGEALRAVLRAQVAAIGDLALRAEADPARSPQAIRDRLAQQVAMLMEAASSLDPARLHAEAAVLAAKADIREEIDRLFAHVSSARALLEGGGAIGRRLDFLAQEINRESNTLCSKSNAVSITAIGLELKVLTDQFREQVQNLE
jgi:uncharacterized protein (TIGR00255 family)